MPLPSLLVFGPQTTWPNPELLAQLRENLLLQPQLQNLSNEIRRLPELWEALALEDPRLDQIRGAQGIEALLGWIDRTETSPDLTKHSNITTMPLTVIIHLIQYFYYFDNDVDYPSQSRILESVGRSGIQGFCAGMLTAIAMACSKDEQSVTTFGATALRVALCIGAYVDLDLALSFETVSMAVRWRSNTGHDRVEDILKSYPNSYISVNTDETRVTITARKGDVSAISQELSEEGMSVMSTGLEGRYHSSACKDSVDQILAFCEKQPGLSFPDANQLLVPVRSNATSQVLKEGWLNRHLLECIMIETSIWYQTISAAVADLDPSTESSILGLGTTTSIPLSLAKRSHLSVVESKSWNMTSRKAHGDRLTSSANKNTTSPLNSKDPYGDNAIAVVGMACKFPGADSIEEFWDLLTAGKSMLAEMPEERFTSKGLRRTPDGKFRFFGNFVRDIAAFDHRFFKKSSREAASMDPQQRLLLECAYQALESSGHFGKSADNVPDDTGCYIGVCTNDYNDNVASHNPNAYSSLGTLRAFIAGKISHFFGWSGPSLTFDTACSSSFVAIHDACRALQGNECSRAVAGGVNLFTTPYFYENLVSASFLSPTGQTKPFDVKADGYCRGEGAGLVVLKKLSAAVADGDNIMGVISSSALNQNSNSVGITVPHSPSQSALYTKAAKMAGVDPKTVSYVEAHGTGTPVGDPREIASIRDVFGGTDRADQLLVSSVKGNIGHLEAASGVASLIKTLLMMKHEMIPMQASFLNLNPAIPALEPDRISIPTRVHPWNARTKVACINNYGASGSNATMILCEPPVERQATRKHSGETKTLARYPLSVSANSAESLKANCAALRAKYGHLAPYVDHQEILASLTYNLAVKQNRALPYALTASASSFEELQAHLAAGANGMSDKVTQSTSSSKPIVLVFGGQVGDAVGLDKGLYDSSSVLRLHLDKCDAILRSFGLSGLYPAIFQTSPVSDIVTLQSALFSLQYACSRAWMECGLKVEAAIGHSLGQLGAMCVAGILSIEESLKLVSGRASLMQKYWGPEKGSMIAIETDANTLERLISAVMTSDAGHSVEIACYNGPTSHVLVGREISITKVQELIKDESSSATTIKAKRLSVTHGFHSIFTEPLLPSLKKLAGELTFNNPFIPLETCSDGYSWEHPSPELIAEHTRSPVYFSQAVDRITQRLGPCTWLEAGSASSVVAMVRRAMDPSLTSEHNFQSANLSGSGAVESLVKTTVSLWEQGHRVQFWPFHHEQRKQYMSLDLPPYQFEKTKHWLDWKEPSGDVLAVAAPIEPEVEEELVTYDGYRDQKKREAEFSVHPRSKQWKAHVSGHAVLGEPLCPAPMYVELATRAAIVLTGTALSASFIPLVEDIEIKAPLGLAQDRKVKMTMIVIEDKRAAFLWAFEIKSQLQDEKPVLHATGRITLKAKKAGPSVEFSRYEKLIDHNRLAAVLSDPTSEALQGAMVYTFFSKVVDYADYYKGVRGVFARDVEAVGRIKPPLQNQEGLAGMITSPLALDSFIQVSGLHVNSMKECGPNQVYVCTKLERIQVSPDYSADDPQSRSWEVYTTFSRSGEKTVSNDIYVFDTLTHGLVMIIHGAFFTRVAISSLSKVLSQANNTATAHTSSRELNETPAKAIATRPELAPIQEVPISKPKAEGDVYPDLRALIHRVTDIPESELTQDASFENLGVDSLMMTEIAAETSKFFHADIGPHDMDAVTDVASLKQVIVSSGGDATLGEQDSSSSENDSGLSGTPTSTEDSFSSSSSNHEYTDGVVEPLAKLLATHLETEDTMSRNTNLAALGLDSLMCMELASDIMTAFGVTLDMHRLDDHSTFGDLSDMVTEQQTPAKPVAAALMPVTVPASGSPKRTTMETVTYKQSGNLSLEADIYYPSEVKQANIPVALLIHGGGHCLYTRKDVNSKQIRSLLSKGFLPVSVDYRFCPEVTLLEGPMTDVRDALQWIRRELPFMPLSCPGIKIDGDRVAVVGWSTGGTLAMSLGFTPQLHGIEPPDAILAFYCPTDYDDDCFKKPIYPRDAVNSPQEDYDLIQSVREEPFASYYPQLNKGAPGSFLMGLADERWRIILHMNWKAQMVPILVNGLPNKNQLRGRDPESFKNLPMPDEEQIAGISPYAQILRGNYRTPTFLMHGIEDDLVPCEQSARTTLALERMGVRCGMARPVGAKHLFDTFPSEDPAGTGAAAVREGYDFLFKQFHL